MTAVALSFSLCAPVARAEPDMGAYLAARQAEAAHDFAAAADFFLVGLRADPGNAVLLDAALRAQLALGRIDAAAPLAEQMVALDIDSQAASLVLMVSDARTGRWGDVFDHLAAGHRVSPLVDGLAQGWAHIGQGDMRRAMAAFDQVISVPEMAIYGLTHKAFALASVGDFEGAAAIFDTDIAGGMRYSRRSAIAHAQVLSQLGRNADAIALIDGVFGAQPDAGISALREVLAKGEAVAYDALRTPAQGLGDLLHVVASILDGEASPQFTLLYVQAAAALEPGNAQARLMAARLLEDLGQHELAEKTYRTVAADDPAFAKAEMGRAEVLRSAGKADAAIAVLEELARQFPQSAEVFATKGDTLRQSDRFDEARDAYSRALSLYPEGHQAKWFVLYTRGIANHQLDDWPAAEADFRAALSLRPDQPQVLNYLGYTLVERGEKLDEALGMIEAAAAARPDNGAIIDSLGWVMFQLGRYPEAVEHLEQAVTLEPVDPVINDHLGDALWAVGRMTEARFQWQRALSFDPEPEVAERIRDKLERGLDLVLIDEGADPIRLARGND